MVLRDGPIIQNLWPAVVNLLRSRMSERRELAAFNPQIDIRDEVRQIYLTHKAG